MKNIWVRTALSLVLLMVAGCVSIPEDSVRLSQEVGKGISSYHESYINILNQYFAQKRALIDDAVVNRYLPRYMDNVKREMVSVGEDPEKLHPFMVRDIVQDVTVKRNEMHEELEKTRLALINTVTGDYLLLTQANSTVTGILQSAVDVKKAASSLAGTVEKVTGKKISFDKIENRFNEYLRDASDLSATGVSLYDGVKDLLGQIKEK
jgi:hypothetical protein